MSQRPEASSRTPVPPVADRLLGEPSGGNRIVRQGPARCTFVPGPYLSGLDGGPSATVLTNVPILALSLPGRGRTGRVHHPSGYDSYLVDSASSHMLVSKIKPCMSKYKQLYRETANGSLNQLSFT